MISRVSSNHESNICLQEKPHIIKINVWSGERCESFNAIEDHYAPESKITKDALRNLANVKMVELSAAVESIENSNQRIPLKWFSYERSAQQLITEEFKVVPLTELPEHVDMCLRTQRPLVASRDCWEKSTRLQQETLGEESDFSREDATIPENGEGGRLVTFKQNSSSKYLPAMRKIKDISQRLYTVLFDWVNNPYRPTFLAKQQSEQKIKLKAEKVRHS